MEDLRKKPGKAYKKGVQSLEIKKTMLLSEKSLAKEWDTKEEDRAWESLQKGMQ